MVRDCFNTSQNGEEMVKILLLTSTISLAAIVEFNVTNNDTTKVNKFYYNGKIKIKGMKVNKFKEGEWTYYKKDGSILKVEHYKNGKLKNSLLLGEKNGK